MLLKLAILLSAICAISAETVEIECSVSGITCVVENIFEELPAEATWKFLCPQDCTQIRMENVSLPRFPREIWNTHQQVTYLALDSTNLEELAFGDFFYAAKLTTFTLYYNQKIMSLRDNCFWGAFELTRLNFYGNKISELAGGAFNGIPLVTQLDVQNNGISYISNDHFRNLPNLRNLDLYLNSIETIESEAFLHNTKLNHLILNSNNLNELDLLLPFINTGSINSNGNRLTKVALCSTSPVFGEYDSGAFLSLDFNELTELYIQPNFAIEQLTLRNNPINRIDTLPVLRSLKVLNFRMCKITSLDGQRLGDKFVNLKTLTMTLNDIHSFSKDTFAGLDRLETLSMTFNELAKVDFPRLESLTYLDVSSNSLREFPYGENIRDTFPALKDLDIRNNDFEKEYLAELEKTLQDQGITVRM